MSDFTHAINLTHDGTLIIRIPKGCQVDKVVVEEMGTDDRKEYQPTHPTPSNTLDALDVNGLEEEIRCTMCKNPMRTDRGCDGGCKYDEKLYADIMKVLHGRIKELPSVQPRKGKITYTHFCEELWGQSSICSLCGCSWQIADDGEDNFCPNCGCRMEEGDSNE